VYAEYYCLHATCYIFEIAEILLHEWRGKREVLAAVCNCRMSFEDFVSNFQRLEICYLGPDTLAIANDDDDDDPDRHKWEGSLFEGGWKQRVNAGGCRNHCMFSF